LFKYTSVEQFYQPGLPGYSLNQLKRISSNS
jgi:hypothetical protein